jgi:hypothetical protein
MIRLKAAAAMVAASAVGLLATASPAMAEGAGVSVGSSDISASGPISTPLCIKTTTNSTITLTNVGTIGAVNAPPVDSGTGTAAVYAGPSVVTFSLAQFYFGPQGTYPTNTCTSPVAVPGAVAVTSWTMHSTSTPVAGVGSASCSGTSGSYVRVTNAYKIQVTGTCTVTDPVVGTASETTTFVFAGNENPCLDDFIVPIPNCGTLAESEFQGEYTQLPGTLYPNVP